jgi:hypothetical protein
MKGRGRARNEGQAAFIHAGFQRQGCPGARWRHGLLEVRGLQAQQRMVEDLADVVVSANISPREPMSLPGSSASTDLICFAD